MKKSKQDDAVVAVMATNGNAYNVNVEKKTVKKVFNSFKELKSIEKELAKNAKVSFNEYLAYIRTSLPSDPIKVDKNSFTVKGYKFKFYLDHIECRDILNFGLPKIFETVPTPRDIVTMLKNEHEHKREFSPAEMAAAEQRGKQLLEERKEVSVEKLAAVKSTDSLEDSRKKALRLIKRVRNRQSDNDKIFSDIPGMIKFQPLNVSIGIAIKKYRDRTYRWAKLLDKLEELIKTETFEKRKNKKVEKFIGLDIMHFNSVSDLDLKQKVPTIRVDNKLWEAGEFYCRFILQKDLAPELYVAMHKWLTGEISDTEFLDKPIQKDRTVEFNVKNLKGLMVEKVNVLIEILWWLEVYDPATLVYNTDGKLKKGMKVTLYSNELAFKTDGVISSLEKGIWIKTSDDLYAIVHNQKYLLK